MSGQNNTTNMCYVSSSIFYVYLIPWIFFLYLHSRGLFFSQMAYTQHQQQQSQLGIVLRFIFFGRRRLMMAHSSRAQIFFHANYFFGKKHIYFLATDLDRRGILWPHHTTTYITAKQVQMRCLEIGYIISLQIVSLFD